MKISDLSKLITTHPDYDEEFSKNQLTVIIEDRKLREQQEIENRKLREQQKLRIESFENNKKLRIESFESNRKWLLSNKNLRKRIKGLIANFS
ncbi:hypothetical protein TNCT_552061 [Trichonephila clavata]|uniref:Uncharacterized protein n=1 Tax=Trichonephila clavata TaxID=2740835 RepID=A0A8X6H7T3_TRICU|nr:hypothetical protein TNCT_552061 [Trichonephila clavata]